MSYAFSSAINSAARICGAGYPSIGERIEYDDFYLDEASFDYEEAKALCLATTVFKDSIREDDIKGAMEEIAYSGYEKAKQFLLCCESEHHGVTVEQLKLVLYGKIKPGHFGMKPSYAN